MHIFKKLFRHISPELLTLLFFLPFINCQQNLQSQDSNCTQLLNAFAEISSHFIKCSIQYAQPLKVCENCVDLYKTVTSQHDKLLTLVDEQGKLCRDRFIDRDRIEIVESSFQYITNLWDRCHCSNCYTENYVMSNETQHYKELSIKTRQCFDGEFEEASRVCMFCMDQYCALNEFYKSLGGDICMDLIDDMNSTRARWSNEFRCKRIYRKAETPMIIAVTILSILPIIFYLGVRKFTLVKNAKLLKGKRLAVNFPSTSGFST